MRRASLQLISQSDGSAGAEFALVLPVFILFLLGTIDVGRYMWEINRIEKATQVGARMAVVTDMVPGGLASFNYGTTLGQGAPIPTSSFGAARCSKPSGTVTCSCSVTPCPTLTPVNSTAFNAIVTRMRQISPEVLEQNVTIIYTNSGLGYAGDPTGSNVAPIVTVQVAGLGFRSLGLQFFRVTLTLPTQNAALTLEDGQGSTSN